MRLHLILAALVVLAAMVMPAVSDEVDDLIVDLKDEDWTVRGCAAMSLGELGDARAVDPLIEALKDDRWDVREVAALALGKIGDAKAVDPLIGVLKDEGNYGSAAAAAEALGEIGDPRAIVPLTEALKDDRQRVRWAAAPALDKIVGSAECEWDSFTPDQTAFVGQQGGVFPLRNSPFEAGSYLIRVGPAGEDGLDLPPVSWSTFGPYELKGGHKYKATIESPRGESLRFEEDPADLLSYSDPSPGYASVYARNNCPGDIWYAICLQPINLDANTSMMSDEGSDMLSGDGIISLGDTTEVDEITPEIFYT
jgi:hypothetical protein